MIFAARRCFLSLLLIAAVVAVPSTLVLSADAQALPSDPNVDNGTHWYGSYEGVHENVRSKYSKTLSWATNSAHFSRRNEPGSLRGSKRDAFCGQKGLPII
jgi:hypothetical protein